MNLPTNQEDNGFEKRGVVEDGRTPPEELQEKTAQSPDDPYDHTAKRLAETVKDSIGDNRNSC